MTAPPDNPPTATPSPQPCPGCGALFIPKSGPVHAYMTSSPGCWQAYGDVLAREYSAPTLFAAAHRLTVDAYALQHPGAPGERRARQSVWLHYCSLLLVFEHNATHAQATAALKQLSAVRFPERPHAPAAFAVSIRDLCGVADPDYAAAAQRFARCAFDAWAGLRDVADDVLGRKLQRASGAVSRRSPAA